MNYEIVAGDVGDIDELQPLWLQMLSHHRILVCDKVPVHPDGESWKRARNAYSDWLAADSAILLIGRDRNDSSALGYVVCRLHPGGPTFDLGQMRGDVDSLVVHDRARGRGLGTALLAAVRTNLSDRGIAYWSIGVLAENMGAAKLYERVGFRPWTQELLARIDNDALPI